MEAVTDSQLPSITQTENAECPHTPEHQDPNRLPTINTDDLPITPLKNKRWLDNATESLETTNVSLKETPTKSLLKSQETNTANSFEELNSISLPNTDNLLDISVPKTTLLGKEQAKKRLHAFSLTKQNSLNILSPLSKKKNIKQPKFTLQPAQDAYNENGEKTDEKYVLVKKPAKKGKCII